MAIIEFEGLGSLGFVFVIIVLLSRILVFNKIILKRHDHEEEANKTTFVELPEDVIGYILSSESLHTIETLCMSRLSKLSRHMWNDLVHSFDFCDLRDRRMTTDIFQEPPKETKTMTLEVRSARE